MRIEVEYQFNRRKPLYSFLIGIDMHGYGTCFELTETKTTNNAIVHCAHFNPLYILDNLLFDDSYMRNTWSINSSKWNNRSLGFEFYKHPNEYDMDSYIRTYNTYKEEKKWFNEIEQRDCDCRATHVLIVPHTLDMKDRILPGIAWIYDTELFPQLFPDKPILIGYYDYSLVLLPHNPEPIILNGLGLDYVFKRVNEAYHTTMEKFDKKLSEKHLTTNQLRSLTYYIFQHDELYARDMFEQSGFISKPKNIAFKNLDYRAFLKSLPKMTELLSDFFAKIEELYKERVLTQPLLAIGWITIIRGEYEHIEYHEPQYYETATNKIEMLRNVANSHKTK